MKHQHGVRNTGWLWWTAFFILLVGGTIAYLLSLQKTDPAAPGRTAMCLTITIISSGICIICATADWWLKK